MNVSVTIDIEDAFDNLSSEDQCSFVEYAFNELLVQQKSYLLADFLEDDYIVGELKNNGIKIERDE